MTQNIVIQGASEHNLKQIDVVIPKNKLIVVTGVSGSGKSSLVLDTLQKECQRQYMESLGLLNEEFQKPRVRKMSGLSPSISIHQHHTNRNPRSTVGTMTDLYSYLRLLYSKIGQQHCPHCLQYTSASQDTDADAIACQQCQGHVPNLTLAHFSFNKPQGACPSCSGLGELHQVDLSKVLDESKAIEDNAIYEWDIHYIRRNKTVFANAAKHYGFSFDTKKPIRELPNDAKDFLLYGTTDERFTRHFPHVPAPKTVTAGNFEGLVTNIMRRYAESGDHPSKRAKFEQMLITASCPACEGEKLNETSRQVKIDGETIGALSKRSLEQLSSWVDQLSTQLPEDEHAKIQPILAEMRSNLDKLLSIRLGYLTLNRVVSSLSGGEYQRFRLAALLDSGLTGVLYILDEPTIGLHSKDTDQLVSALKRLRDLGNTVIVIEHDMDFMRQADWIIDIGPGAGVHGGEVIAEGTPEDILTNPRSITGRYMKKNMILAHNPVDLSSAIHIEQASSHNLKQINVKIPLQALTAVTGVSGSGKSTLIFDVLARGQGAKAIKGLELFNEIIQIDQSPIGKSSRSNAATYTDAFTPIRSLFAKIAKTANLSIQLKDFSFNVPGGRCETCEGAGFITTVMHFMPDVESLCPACRGRRYQEHILAVRYQGANIHDVLQMSVDEALRLFFSQPAIRQKLQLLSDIGLGYLKLGQSANTLSGGEAQRIKLAKELSRKASGHILYLLDEPTTGLHPQDIEVLYQMIRQLVKKRHTVCVVEHNLEWIAASDWIIDLGPEGGAEGGSVIAEGTPREVAESSNRNKKSHTGALLARYEKNIV